MKLAFVMVTVSYLAVAGVARASGILGESGIVEREKGSFQLGFELQKVFTAQRKFQSTTGTITGTNGYDGNGYYGMGSSNIEAQLVTLRGDLLVIPGVVLYGKLGMIRERSDTSYYIDADAGRVGGLGLRIVPVQLSPIKVGMTLQGLLTQSTGVRDNANTGIYRESPDYLSLRGSGTSSDKLTTKRLDLLLDFAVDTRYVRPYLGMLYSYIEGNYSTSFQGNMSGSSCPGGVCSTITTPFAFSMSTKVKGESTIGGVIGFSVNQHESIGFNLEYHYIPNKDSSFVGSVVMRF